MKLSKDYKSILVFSLIFALLLSIIPLEGVYGYENSEFSQASYVSDKVAPSTALVYSIIAYKVYIYVPMAEGVEEWWVKGYIAGMGSGFFVNPDGYLVTNGHIVFCYESENYREDEWTRYDVFMNAINALISALIKEGYTVPEGAVNWMIHYNIELKHGRVDYMDRHVYVLFGEATAGDVVEHKGTFEATVVKASPYFGRDLAILKVSLSNTPALILGEPEDIKVGDSVYAFGYPGVVTFHPALSPSTMLKPSMTAGIISGRRLTLKGVSAVQHSAEVTHGNSGGPLVNGEGKVIGVNNMGSIDVATGLEVAGFNFAVSVDVLREFLKENGIENYLGPVGEIYEKGLAYYYAGMYGSAKKKFEETQALFKYQWRAEQLIQKCQRKIAEGEKAPSAVNITITPSEIKVGNSVTVLGKIKHAGDMPIPVKIKWPSATVEIEYSGPGGSTVTKRVMLDETGTFSDSFAPDKPGKWIVKAKWSGDEDHEGDVSEPAAFKSIVESSISLTASPTTSKLGKESVQVSGKVEFPVKVEVEWAKAPISIDYIRPDGFTLSKKVEAKPEGSFSDSFMPDLEGMWVVKASWQGSDYLLGGVSDEVQFEVTAESDATLLVMPAKVKFGKQPIQVSGKISTNAHKPPDWSGITVTAEYVRPDGSTVTKNLRVSSDGTFSDIFMPDAEGPWKVKVRWKGSGYVLGAQSREYEFTVEPLTLIEQLIESGAIYALIGGIMVIILAVVIIFKRRKAGKKEPTR